MDTQYAVVFLDAVRIWIGNARAVQANAGADRPDRGSGLCPWGAQAR